MVQRRANKRCQPQFGHKIVAAQRGSEPMSGGERKGHEREQASYTISTAKFDSPQLKSVPPTSVTPSHVQRLFSAQFTYKEIGISNGTKEQ